MYILLIGKTFCTNSYQNLKKNVLTVPMRTGSVTAGPVSACLQTKRGNFDFVLNLSPTPQKVFHTL